MPDATAKTDTDPTRDPNPAERRTSVLEAQVMAMRATAMAGAQTMQAIAVQCDAFLLMLGTFQNLRELGKAPSPSGPRAPTADMPHRTFGHRTAAPEDKIIASADELASRIREATSTPPTRENAEHGNQPA